MNSENEDSQSSSTPSRPLKLEIDEALLDVEDAGEAFPSPSSSLLPPPMSPIGALEADAEEIHISGAPRSRHFKSRTPLAAKDLKKEAIIGNREEAERQAQAQSQAQER